jgi:hypothetical protein
MARMPARYFIELLFYYSNAPGDRGLSCRLKDCRSAFPGQSIIPFQEA